MACTIVIKFHIALANIILADPIIPISYKKVPFLGITFSFLS